MRTGRRLNVSWHIRMGGGGALTIHPRSPDTHPRSDQAPTPLTRHPPPDQTPPF